LLLIRLRGVTVSTFSRFMRSCAVRRSLRKPLRNSSPASSWIVRTRRLPEVVDVVDLALAPAQAEDVLDRLHEVGGAERLLRLGRVGAELAVEAEATDAAEAIPRLVEELLVEELARLLDLRRIAGTQTLVDLEQRLFVRVRRVSRSVLRIRKSSGSRSTSTRAARSSRSRAQLPR
jgi:hypothetical protein